MDMTFSPIWMMGVPAATAGFVFLAGAVAGRGRGWVSIGLLGLAVAVATAGVIMYLLGIHEPMYPNTRNTLFGIAVMTGFELGGLAIIGVAAYRRRSSRSAEVTAMASAVVLTTLIACVAWVNCVIPAACRIFD